MPLPLYLTKFVGHERERALLPSLLLSKRLLTLTGPGGVGKTRLALEVANELSVSFPESIYMVELASLSDPHLVSHALASALSLRTDRDSSPSSLLITTLQERHVLLLLDNCEHVLAGCAPLAETLLQACPHLYLLTTSREPLEVTGEAIWRVATLACPESKQAPPLEQLANYEAVQLFCERAADTIPYFRLNSYNASAIAHICSQLDGLPLALELAAALLPMLSVDQLAARLDERFTLLRNSKRTSAVRHLSLQATLDWSYSLLSPAEQALFERLAIFVGSWDLEAVEQICAMPASSTVFETLARLVNSSLVIAEERERPETDTYEVRYRLLNTVRQYALEKLEASGNWPQLCEQHYTWYLRLAEQANEHLYDSEQLAWLHRLEREKTNMNAALTRMLDARRLDATVQLADALRRFWITRNKFSEGRHWFEAVLTAQNDHHQLSLPMRARALFGAAEFARYQGLLDHACSLLEELSVLEKTLDDALGLAETQTYLGLVMGMRGDYEQATQLCQTSLAFYRQRKYHRGITTALTTLAFLALAQGHYQHALTISEEASQLLRQDGNLGYLMYNLFTQAQAAMLYGALEQARTACREALQLAQAQTHTYGLAASLSLIGSLAGLEGHHTQAARLFGAAQALQDRVQAPHPPAGRALQERMALSTHVALGKEQFASHYSAGQACSLEQILQEAEAVLQVTPTSSDSKSSDALALPFPLSTLSRRQLEILTLVATGLTDAQVAEHLKLSPRTVSKHLQSIYNKLNINNRSAATRLAFEHGLL